MPAPILHKGLWPTVSHLVHTNTARGACTGIFPTTLLAYCSATYPQGMTCESGLEARLQTD